MAKVTVYIPTYNYAKYIANAIESVLYQTMQDWELIVINDGSTDNTNEILKKYENDARIRIIDQANKGLNITNNIALRLAEGKYIMRLDGDDYLDENILLILSNILDKKVDIGLVYPDYYQINENGEILEIVRRKKIEQEVKLLDLPAHGACTMFRRDLLLELGGYIEDFSCQDGYELWLRFVQKYKPFNVNLPLFYYRQHGKSLTRDQAKILNTRRQIKSKFVDKHFKGEKPKVLGVILAIGSPICPEMNPFIDIAGKPLIWYTLTEALKSKALDKIVISSENDKVLDYSKQFTGVLPLKRPKEYAKATTKTSNILTQIISEMKSLHNYEPQVVAALYINTPLRKAYHIDKAVNTMMIFNVDSVISIQEELAPCYHHQEFGLTPINDVSSSIRIERKSIYKGNGAIYLGRVDSIKSERLLGKKVGHITMLPEESVKINGAFDLWLARKIMNERKDNSEKTIEARADDNLKCGGDNEENDKAERIIQ